MKLITITGMSRSGNHGIIRWIIGHYEENGYSVHFYNNTVTPFLDHINFIFPHVDKSIKKVFLVSFEDIIINERFSKLSTIADHNILLVRDPLNLFASRIKGLSPDRGIALPENSTEKDKLIAKSITTKNIPDQIQKYHNHYEEFSGKTNLIKNKICIDYLKWVNNESYRKELIETKFLLRFTDSKYCNRAGSSFGDPPLNTKDYFDRWKLFWNDPVYEQIKNNNDLIEISKKLGVILE